MVDRDDDDDGLKDETEFSEEDIGPLERLLAEEPGPLPFRGPEGPLGPLDSIEPIPEATAQTMICLRGPCRHYLAIETQFNAGNTKGTLRKKPRAQNRFCLIATDSTDLTDELVTNCSSWEPQDPVTVEGLKIKRRAWLEANAATCGLKYDQATLTVEKTDPTKEN